jgi:transcriptional regulator with XRE-family HTH domain
VANRLRTLNPQASPAALFGAELRALRLRRHLSLAAVGRLVHVSGDLVGKIEKAERRPQADLVARLDGALEAEGRLERLAVEVLDDVVQQPCGAEPVLSPDDALPVLRTVIGTVRADDHAMNERAKPDALVAHARAAERAQHLVGKADRSRLRRSIAEAYQLAGWMSFDHGRSARAEKLLGSSRDWIERAADPALAAFVLGPNLSFVATYGGDPARGAERAWGAIGWARRSGNRRLSAFTMAIGARAHARLGERDLCLDLLSDAESELDRHVPGGDDDWLSVFDRSALEGHRGSCFLDLGMPDRALAPLAQQDELAPERFVRNRIIWLLDRVDALLELRETEQACAELLDATASLITISPRVLRRFRVVELRLRSLPRTPTLDQATEQLRAFTEAFV